MLSLMYVSRAEPGITPEDVKGLAHRAAENNARRRVTGLLAYNSLSFMQLLEGEGAAVLETMRGIERDSRHSGITYIRQDERENRECPDWSMRSLLTPLAGVRSATVFTGTLPPQMELDTKILFTSFASSLTAEQARHHAEQSDRVMGRQREAGND
ncbi:BLUF domain-containing protein [Parerythrobacter aestuarii]|uniref:BLUF domain-containing protein n=1 Tax=Parerythrobacter aestuarii TaxID=3020909 RepID=UPI0024DE9B7D|nr:BLUF domain-containing protein [Parerythrobacter aestuarii]